MPNIKSSKKRVRVSAKKRARNTALKTSLRTSVKRYEVALADNNENTATCLNNAIQALDKAVSKGIIHKNAAARKKSRLTRKFNAVSQA